MATEYRFERLAVTGAKGVTASLNALARDGWRVVSHTESSDEYSFVLIREAEGEPG